MAQRQEELKEKVLALPREPGVYIMKDRTGKVIYVGKAKALKNRVSNYIHKSAGHSPKTRKMISCIWDFDIIVTKSEFEALVLENSLIKKYKPKYNILLKDDKGYPYIRMTQQEPYPDFSIASRPQADRARYFGPYNGRRSARQAVETIQGTLGLKSCRKKLPRDIGKERPCLNAHMGKCCAPCSGQVTPEEYAVRIAQAVELLEGRQEGLVRQLEEQMMQAAEQMQFERAAALRDRMRAVQNLQNRQTVVSSGYAQLDVVAYVQGQTRGCIVVLHYLKGSLEEKEYTMLDGLSEEDGAEAVAGFLRQYYARRGAVPRCVLISHEVEGQQALTQWLSQIAGHKVELSVPQRGRRRELLVLAQKNAREEIERTETRAERTRKSLEILGDILSLPAPPARIESYDISHTAGREAVASLVVLENGQPKRSAYRRFRIEQPEAMGDDYRAMEEVLTRRLQRYVDGDEKFAPLPDLLLMDGGQGQAHVAQRVLERFGLTVPVFGMVKDDKHRTRALVSPQGEEFGVQTLPAVYALLGRLQEEVHRVAIEYHRALRGKESRRSALDGIPGVGPARRKALLHEFQTIGAVRQATVEQLRRAVPEPAARAVYRHFHPEEGEHESH